MNENKRGFKISYLVVVLVAVLLFALLFIDFGNNGKELTRYEVQDLIEGTYDAGNGPEQATCFYYKNGRGYLIVDGSRYKENQMPTYSDYFFKYDEALKNDVIDWIDARKADGYTISVIYAPAGINFWDILVPILYVGFAIFIFFMLFRMVAGANKNAMAFGKTKVKTYTIS